MRGLTCKLRCFPARRRNRKEPPPSAFCMCLDVFFESLCVSGALTLSGSTHSWLLPELGLLHRDMRSHVLHAAGSASSLPSHRTFTTTTSRAPAGPGCRLRIPSGYDVVRPRAQVSGIPLATSCTSSSRFFAGAAWSSRRCPSSRSLADFEQERKNFAQKLLGRLPLAFYLIEACAVVLVAYHVPGNRKTGLGDSRFARMAFLIRGG